MIPWDEKVQPLEAAVRLCVKRREAGRKVVFTNGCFDLLHLGHLVYLKAARDLGDFLVVGLNDDASVTRLKGPGRPLRPLRERALMLAGLSFVDLVVPFAEDTPLKTIESILPVILVKGGDYTPETVVGRNVVESCGGKVVIIPLVEGYSTTGLLTELAKKGT